MTPEQAVAEGRAEAESMMTDTIRITRRSSKPVTDPQTGGVSFPTVVVYPTGDGDGRARVQTNALQDREVAVAGADYAVSTFSVQIPYDAEPEGHDVAEVLASNSDPRMVGRTFRIDRVPRKTHATMLRCGAEEVES